MPLLSLIDSYLRVVDQKDPDVVFAVLGRGSAVAGSAAAAAGSQSLRIDGDAEVELPLQAGRVEPELGRVEAVAAILRLGPGRELLDGPLDAEVVHDVGGVADGAFAAHRAVLRHLGNLRRP